jgi:hypothetical protein
MRKPAPLHPWFTADHLLAYSPELNPAEHVWEYVCENDMRNRIFRDLDQGMETVSVSLHHLHQQPETLRSMIAFPWILGSASLMHHV